MLPSMLQPSDFLDQRLEKLFVYACVSKDISTTSVLQKRDSQIQPACRTRHLLHEITNNLL